jgi:hypothetical protein
VARARLDAGWRLAEERLGPAVLTLKKEASVPTGVVNGSLEDEARQEAGRLFARG